MDRVFEVVAEVVGQKWEILEEVKNKNCVIITIVSQSQGILLVNPGEFG